MAILDDEPVTDATGRGRRNLAELVWPGDIGTVISRTGIYELNALIKAVLDEHYPADIFGNEDSIASLEWYGHGVPDPGIRWVALLRAALKQVPE